MASRISPETYAIAGAIVTIKSDGQLEILRGIVRQEDGLDEDRPESASSPRPEFSAALVQSLTEAKSAAISATLAKHYDIALAAVVHAMARAVFWRHGDHSSLQLKANVTSFKEESQGAEQLKEAHDNWSERLPEAKDSLFQWCLEQDRGTLLELLAFCAACTVNTVESKQDRDYILQPSAANYLTIAALALAMRQYTAWFMQVAVPARPDGYAQLRADHRQVCR